MFRRFSICCSKIFSAILFFNLLIPNVGHAQVESRWIGSDGVWSDSANWDNGVPNGFAIAIFESGTGQIIQDVENLSLFGMQIDSTTANLVLQNDLTIEQALTWTEGTISGPQALQLTGFAEINGGQLQTTFENFGFVEFGTNGEFTRLGSPTGGTWNNRPGSSAIATQGVLIGSFGSSATGTINIDFGSTFLASGTSFQSVWKLNNDGVMQLDAAGFFFGGYEQTQDAELILINGGADFFQVTELSGLVSGTGSILNLSGAFDVEFEPGGRQIGHVESGGNLLMTPDTISNFQIGPDSTSDILTNIGGPLQLDGTLNIEALPGSMPGVYTLFSYNNAFMLQVDNIQLGSVPAGFNGFLVHQPQLQRVELIVETIDPVILGDINRDGAVDLLDVNPMIQLLASGGFQVEADINGDGELNLLDIAGFIEILSGN